MAEIICPTCKTKNRGTAQYCAECGSPLLTGLKPEPAGRKTPAQPPSAEQPPVQAGSARWVLQNRYEMGEALGQGGFGSVYKAIDANLNRVCAIKENLATSEESQRQFMREATVLANLSHPNLPRVTDHFIVPGQGQYLVMDFVEGDDLEKILRKREIIPLGEALEWVIQVAGALEYLHSQEPPVFHRDIKPANIRITPKGKAMLVDFGLVKVYEEHLKTTVGARAITPGFAPPEQYGRGGTDGRTDIYALGATLYNMVTGHEPLESVRRMAGEHMPSAHALNPGVPLRLSDAIERAMDLDPLKRYQHIAEFLIELQAAKAALEQAGEAESPVTVVVSPDMDAPDLVKTAAYAPSKTPSSPAPPTQMTGAGEAFPATLAVEHPQSPPAVSAAKPAGPQRNWLLIGGGVAVLALLCLALFGGGMFALFSRDRGDPVQKTLTAHARLNAPVEKTLTARSEPEITSTSAGTPEKPTQKPESTATPRVGQDATSTRVALKVARTKEAATQVAGRTATAKSAASATRAAIPAEVAPFDQSAVKKYGPRSGNLVHNIDNYIDTLSSGMSLRNFITEVTFEVPYSASTGAWDFGIIFRHYQGDTQFRFFLLSDKSFQITRTIGSPDGEVLAEGTIDNLKTGKGDQNKIRLYVIEGDGWLFVNDEFTTKFDASKHYTGVIMIGVDFITGSTKAGAITPYKDWTIWSVPAQP